MTAHSNTEAHYLGAVTLRTMPFGAKKMPTNGEKMHVHAEISQNIFQRELASF